mmetsp:Transcript_36225/g.80602  ORF Transcript_36225/g.80602 Transcript_36225/m.80602 type:complete len:637 (+) Transcript_36225:105-2015(+)|eukprot:CAMPEP_0202893206 /NCGR_PEP_ID=MMETSP1392-20130828/2830_1 /ASSEMBLY_ACC=CAM_ASM_000868 /TAXON_ID=225041 /ORGANISM="Chlamydomonas chlamydogama, Strain SAG 11-48b" /LENGTH=636 /DNA_ID=CAMNT_0049577459 /DNA_START=70 /DNA_END=1980 /DNA_ORIENTATION=-
MVFNVRQRQTDSILKLLNFNTAQTAGKDPGDLYKILILDKNTKDIVAPLLRLNDLRKHGVTLHLMIEAERQPIPDVPAIYLVQPTQANIERIAQDITQNLYETMHLNFTSCLPSKLIEQLATAAVKSGNAQKVAKLFDQYVSFVALEPSLFSLALPNAYVDLNDPAARDHQIEASVSSIVEGLFSVCVTLGVVPVIRCPPGGAAEHVAGLLDQKLRDALKARNNLFSEGVLGLSASITRPLLCLFDRNFDLSAALQHSWTYKPMVQDVLGMRLNKVTLPGEAGPGPSSAMAAAQKRAYDIDDRDFFWESCGMHVFPKVAEEVETQLKAYRAAVEEINKKTAHGPQDGVAYDPDDLLQRNTQNLMSAVSSLPELQERKKVLDKHTNLATALLSQIKARALDQFHNLSEDVLTGKGDVGSVVKTIQAPKGTAQDKLRLAIIWLLAYDGLPSDSDLGELENALKGAGADVTALSYVRTLKRNNLTGTQPKGAAAGADTLSALASQGNLLDWADKAFGQGLSHVTKSVKTLLSGARQAPMTVAVEALVEGKAGTPEYDTYTVFDPKAPAGRAGLDRAKGPFREALVFVIGGGNYLERETLAGWAARAQPPKQLIYGTTEVLSGEEFLQQLAELGHRSGIK